MISMVVSTGKLLCTSLGNVAMKDLRGGVSGMSWDAGSVFSLSRLEVNSSSRQKSYCTSEYSTSYARTYTLAL